MTAEDIGSLGVRHRPERDDAERGAICFGTAEVELPLCADEAAGRGGVDEMSHGSEHATRRFLSRSRSMTSGLGHVHLMASVRFGRGAKVVGMVVQLRAMLPDEVSACKAATDEDHAACPRPLQAMRSPGVRR